MVVQTNIVPAVNGGPEHIKNKINSKPKKTKNQLRRLKQKQKKQSVRSRFLYFNIFMRLFFGILKIFFLE
jgi:hypothetical protein